MIKRAVRLHRTCVMKGDFQRAIWPLTVAMAVCGFTLIEHPWGKPRRLLSLLYAIVPLSLQIALYASREIWQFSSNVVFLRSVCDFTMRYSCLISFASICLTQWHGRRYERCLGALNEIDETLIHLGSETNHSKLRRVVVVGLIIWMVWCCMLESIDTTVIPASLMRPGFAFLVRLLMDAQLHLPTLIDMYFWCVVGYAGTRFDCVNSTLRKLRFKDGCMRWFRNDQMSRVPQFFIPDEKTKRTTWTMIHLHFQLCQTLRDMHRAFEAQISLRINFCCIYILCSVIFTFRMLLLPFEGDKFQFAFTIWIWAVGSFGNIIVTNQLCENISIKATRVAHTTVKLLRLMDDKEMCEVVSLVLLQTKLHPLRFSNLGMCDFGHRYMLEIFSSVVTMVTIILQLKTGLQTM